MASSARTFEIATWSRPALLRGNHQDQSPLGKRDWSVWWWLAPLLLLVLAVIALFWVVDSVEQTLEAEAPLVLGQAGISVDGLVFEADYRDLEITGALPAGTTAAEVEETLESFDSSRFDVRNATFASTTVVGASQTFAAIDIDATSSGDTITLVGTVPSQGYFDQITSAAGTTGLAVDATLLTVAGLDAIAENPEAQIENFSSLLGSLTSGSFTSATISVGDDGPVTGEIVAVDETAAIGFESLEGSRVVVLAPTTLGSLDVEATFDGERIVLDGTVFSREQSLTLETNASLAVGRGNVINNLELSALEAAVPGSDERVDAFSALLRTFSGLASADGSTNDTDVTVNGVALDLESQSRSIETLAAAEAAGLRPGGNISLQAISPVQEQIDLLQTELNALQEEIQQTVVFESGSAVLSLEATETLDKVVEAMIRHPLPTVDVGGHTDSQGDADENLALSQARANAVAAYVAESLDTDRLAAIGFGDSQPVADNDTPEGRLQNRRVEFIAKESF